MNSVDTKVFRFVVALKEDIIKENLEKALILTLNDYPVFRSVLKKGLFWYYLEESNLEPTIEEDHERPCSLIRDGLLFRVTYYKKRINLEVCHALTDGTGTLIFLKALTANYLNITYNLKPDVVVDNSSEKEKSDDSFNKYKGKIKGKMFRQTTLAHQFKERKYIENNLKIIEGEINVKELLKLSKEKNVSLTIYLTSVLIMSIGKNMSLKERKRPIVITIPVNLRQYYPSRTVRNFFNVVNVSFYYKENSIDEIIEDVSKQFKDNLSKENINNKMNSMSMLEDIFIVRLVPLFIKDLVLNIAYKISDKYQTMTLSNLGVIDMPDIYNDYIDYFNAFINTDHMQLCTCSFKNKMYATFTSKYIDSDVEMNFFRELSGKDIDISINTNMKEG